MAFAAFMTATFSTILAWTPREYSAIFYVDREKVLLIYIYIYIYIYIFVCIDVYTYIYIQIYIYIYI